MAIVHYPEIEIQAEVGIISSEGEKSLLDFLCQNLNDEYEIFVHPYLNGDVPDILLMRKYGGILLIQVCDWQIQQFQFDTLAKAYRSWGGSLHRSPIAQVINFKENFFNLHIPHLLELKMREPKHWAIVACAVFFCHENQEDLNDFLAVELYGQSADEENVEYTPNKSAAWVDIIAKDILSSSYLHGLLERHWISKTSKFFDAPIHDSVLQIIKPPFHFSYLGKNINYTRKQLEFCFSQGGDHKIRGVAGAGKTLVLAKRAVNAQLRTQGKVLILYFNIALRNYIRERIGEVEADFQWSKFHILNYHDFINSFMNNLGLVHAFPRDFDNMAAHVRDDYFESSFYSNLNLFVDHAHEIEKYAAIFIDEIQDYQVGWVKMLKKYFLVEGGELVGFGDSKQDIYGRVEIQNSKMEFGDKLIGGRWKTLPETKRAVAPAIKSFIYKFQEKFLSGKHQIDEAELTQLGLFDKVHYAAFSSMDFDAIVDFIDSYSTQIGSEPNDVCVLSFTLENIREMEHIYRKKYGKKSYILAETKEYYDYLKGFVDVEEGYTSRSFERDLQNIRKHKRLHFQVNSGKVKFVTVHSFKGWEANTVFLIVEGDSWAENYEELVYTGFTRCSNHLIFILVDSPKLSRFLEELTFVEKIPAQHSAATSLPQTSR